jgi:mono/diheme cytochrome c family protein
MKMRLNIFLLTYGTALALAGCRSAPGRPLPGSEAIRPDQVLDFPTLYAENCAACHGEHCQNGAAISLANPVYLAYAGAADVQRITSDGVAGTLMPPFAKSKGGMLTDRQIAVLVQGMMNAWAKPAAEDGEPVPAYTASGPGKAVNGEQVFTSFCARCHGADGTGSTVAGGQAGSLVDPAYLALISDAGLRSILVAGQPEQGMPNYLSDGSRPLTEPEITDAVAFLAQHRTATPGQIYREHP